MEAADKYIDQKYYFKGKWDVPSVCGIKVIKSPGKTMVIATNLYKSNPGTSISRWSAQLATAICNDLNIDSNKLIFIEHNPDRHSKLDFYEETFDIVEFRWDGDRFVEPVWRRVSKKEVNDMLP